MAHGHGSTIGVLDGGSYHTFAKVKKIKVGDLEFSELDDSHLGMTNPVKESSPGLGDHKEIEFECILTDSEMDYLYTKAHARSTHTFKVTFPSTATFVGSGWFKSVPGGDIPEDGHVMGSIKIKPNGKWTFTAA